jgi:RNA polymerase sigma-70 factor, ECF subfamily
MSLLSLRRVPTTAGSPQPDRGEPCLAVPSFETVYEENLKFVWRAARRLGIDPGDTDDIVQEVFVVAHRKLPEFEGRAQVKTWLFKILVRVVRHYFRTQQRKPGHRPADALGDLDGLHDRQTRGPAWIVHSSATLLSVK